MGKLRNAVGKDLVSARVLAKALNGVNDEESLVKALEELQKKMSNWVFMFQRFDKQNYLIVVDVPLKGIGVWEDTEFLREKVVITFE